MLLSEFLNDLGVQEGFSTMTQNPDAIKGYKLINYINTNFCIAKEHHKQETNRKSGAVSATDYHRAIIQKELLKN